MKRITKLTNRPLTRYLKGFVKICDPDQYVALSVPITNGEIILQGPCLRSLLAINRRFDARFRSFDQEIIRFQVGALGRQYYQSGSLIFSNPISFVYRRSSWCFSLGQGRKSPRDLAGDIAVQICQDDDDNALFGVVDHVRVKPDVISIMLNHQATVHAAYVQTTGIVTSEWRDHFVQRCSRQ